MAENAHAVMYPGSIADGLINVETAILEIQQVGRRGPRKYQSFWIVRVHALYDRHTDLSTPSRNLRERHGKRRKLGTRVPRCRWTNQNREAHHSHQYTLFHITTQPLFQHFTYYLTAQNGRLRDT